MLRQPAGSGANNGQSGGEVFDQSQRPGLDARGVDGEIRTSQLGDDLLSLAGEGYLGAELELSRHPLTALEIAGVSAGAHD